MNSIEIDNQVFAELERRATGFNVKPNDVLRRILGLSEPPSEPPSEKLTTPQPPPPAPVASTVTDFVKSEQFQRHNQAVDRYLIILGWLHSAHPKQFTEAALKFHRGSRA
jgi:negative regulator of replication initiation